MNPFDKLGIPRGSGKAEIAAAFRALARECHPDLHPGDPGAKARFQELNEAYEAANAAAGTAAGPHPPSGPAKRRPRLRREASITVAEAVTGCEIDLEEAAGQCPGCAGEGRLKSRAVHQCETCAGSGISGYKERGMIRVRVGCPDCGGSGRTTRIRCAECGGTGRRHGTSARVAIPGGVSDGEVFEVKGAADGSQPDIELVIRIRDSDGFRMARGDVEADLEIEVWEAAMGCTKEVAAPDGRKFQLKVPPGSRHGRRFRLKGQTLSSGTRRDFVVVVAVKIPDASAGTVRDAYAALAAALGGATRAPR